MHDLVLHISWTQVAITSLLVLLTGILSLLMRLRLERDLLIGTLRTVIQLTLLGYLLTVVFAIENLFAVLALFFGMITAAAITISGRIKNRQHSFMMPVFFSMLLSYFAIALFILVVVVRPEPWYLPQYFIPIAGMIIGNSMNALALAIDTWFDDIASQKETVELYLSLGATPEESTEAIFRNAIRKGMIPSVNAMMTVGLVSIPGMMTGQILAGADPLLAVKYQIVVMLMLVGSTAISTVIAMLIVRRRSFTAAWQLKT